MSVVIDTCVWTRFLRRERRVEDPLAQEVARLVRADVVRMLGAIRQELLSGAKPQDRFDQLKQYLRFFPNIQLDEADDEKAAEYYNLCRNKGVRGTATDYLICAVATRHRLRIFTTDTDFDNYATHIPIRLHRFAARAG